MHVLQPHSCTDQDFFWSTLLLLELEIFCLLLLAKHFALETTNWCFVATRQCNLQYFLYLLSTESNAPKSVGGGPRRRPPPYLVWDADMLQFRQWMQNISTSDISPAREVHI